MGKRPETITRKSEARYTHKKIIAREDGLGVNGEFAVVKLRLEPLSKGSGFQFVNADTTQLRSEHITGVEEGIRAASERGVIDGGAVVDLRVTLLGGAYHEIDSNARTFNLAAQEAFWEAMRKAGPKIILQ